MPNCTVDTAPLNTEFAAGSNLNLSVDVVNFGQHGLNGFTDPNRNNLRKNKISDSIQYPTATNGIASTRLPIVERPQRVDAVFATEISRTEVLDRNIAKPSPLQSPSSSFSIDEANLQLKIMSLESGPLPSLFSFPTAQKLINSRRTPAASSPKKTDTLSRTSLPKAFFETGQANLHSVTLSDSPAALSPFSVSSAKEPAFQRVQNLQDNNAQTSSTSVPLTVPTDKAILIRLNSQDSPTTVSPASSAFASATLPIVNLPGTQTPPPQTTALPSSLPVDVATFQTINSQNAPATSFPINGTTSQATIKPQDTQTTSTLSSLLGSTFQTTKLPTLPSPSSANVPTVHLQNALMTSSPSTLPVAGVAFQTTTKSPDPSTTSSQPSEIAINLQDAPDNSALFYFIIDEATIEQTNLPDIILPIITTSSPSVLPVVDVVTFQVADSQDTPTTLSPSPSADLITLQPINSQDTPITSSSFDFSIDERTFQIVDESSTAKQSQSGLIDLFSDLPSIQSTRTAMYRDRNSSLTDRISAGNDDDIDIDQSIIENVTLPLPKNFKLLLAKLALVGLPLEPAARNNNGSGTTTMDQTLSFSNVQEMSDDLEDNSIAVQQNNETVDYFPMNSSYIFQSIENLTETIDSFPMNSSYIFRSIENLTETIDANSTGRSAAVLKTSETTEERRRLAPVVLDPETNNVAAQPVVVKEGRRSAAFLVEKIFNQRKARLETELKETDRQRVELIDHLARAELASEVECGNKTGDPAGRAANSRRLLSIRPSLVEKLNSTTLFIPDLDKVDPDGVVCGNNRNKRCCKQPHKFVCPDGRQLQLVTRWFRLNNQTECSSYNYAYCGYDSELTDRPIKYKDECNAVCFTADEQISSSFSVLHRLKFEDDSQAAAKSIPSV